MSSESEAETEAGDGSGENVEATQQDLPAEPSAAPVPARPFLFLVNRANGQQVKVVYDPGGPAKSAGRNRAKCDIHPGDDFHISGVHLVFLFLGSGIRIVDVSSGGTYIVNPETGVRTKLQKFGHKPPFPEGNRPGCKDMSMDLQPGIVLQLGSGGLGMDSFGVASTIPYTGAEFMVTAGEGRCGTGPRSKSKRKVDELSGEMASDDDDVEVLGVGQGRRSASAANNGAQAKARRHQAQSRSEDRYANVRRKSGNKGSNQKLQTHDKRRTVFLVHNKGNAKGKGGKGKVGKGEGGKGKGGKGKSGWGVVEGNV